MTTKTTKHKRPSVVAAKEIKKTHATFIKSIEALAERMRKEVVIPFCDQHGVWFVTGIGVYSFEKLLGKPGNDDSGRITNLDWDDYLDWRADTVLHKFSAYAGGEEGDHEWFEARRPPEGYEKVRAVIDLPVPGSHAWGGVEGTLGLYMRDYKGKRK